MIWWKMFDKPTGVLFRQSFRFISLSPFVPPPAALSTPFPVWNFYFLNGFLKFFIFFQITCCNFQDFCYNNFCSGVWRSLVARSAGGREVAGSNPVTPIFCFKKDFWKLIPEVLFCYLPSTFLPFGIFSFAGGFLPSSFPLAGISFSPVRLRRLWT